MKKLIKKIEDIMVAITFAEAGEYDTAKEILNGPEISLNKSSNNGGQKETEEAAIDALNENGI